MLLQQRQLVVRLEGETRVPVAALDLSGTREQQLHIVQERVHARVALLAALVLDQHPSGVALVTLLALDARNAGAVAAGGVAREAARVRDNDTLPGAVAVDAALLGEVPVVGQTPVAPEAVHARLALALTCEGNIKCVSRGRKISGVNSFKGLVEKKITASYVN